MRKALIISILLVCCAAGLFAELPGNNPYTLVSRGSEGDYPLYTLRTDNGFTFTLLERVPLTEGKMNTVRKLIGTITSFGTMKVATARILVKEEVTECFVTLSSFTYKDTDLMGVMPSGMAFYLENDLRYDITLVTKGQRIRLTGQFSSEVKLVELIDRVVARPYEYLQMQDPEFIMNRFAEYDRRLSSLEEVVLFMGNRGFFKLVTPVARETIETVITWKKENPELTADDILDRAKEQDLNFKKKEVQMILIVYFGEYPPEK